MMVRECMNNCHCSLSHMMQWQQHKSANQIMRHCLYDTLESMRMISEEKYGSLKSPIKISRLMCHTKCVAIVAGVVFKVQYI